jgi:hypothetical protein
MSAISNYPKSSLKPGISEYLKCRVDDQIEFYGKKSRVNKFRYRLLQVIIMVASGFVPLVNISDFASLQTRIISSVLGSITIIITGISQLEKYQETWILYRTTEELLKKEKNMFLHNAGDYSTLNDQERNNLFVERIETIVSSETARYFSARQPQTPPGDQKGSQGE